MADIKIVTTIDEYISMFSPEIQKRCQELRETIRLAAPDASEKISWRMPTFFHNGNLIHFAVHKNHIGVYPGPHAIEMFNADLHCHPHSKGAIRFSNDQPLPFDLIKRIVQFLMIESKNK
jgi:uncharacterized protein YdhG (YjbR/CyaY superfamily)